MIHWLSDYNYDFALASIPVQLLIILFYSFRRNLPIRQSHCFLVQKSPPSSYLTAEKFAFQEICGLFRRFTCFCSSYYSKNTNCR